MQQTGLHKVDGVNCSNLAYLNRLSFLLETLINIEIAVNTQGDEDQWVLKFEHGYVMKNRVM